jgi:alkaline phosphatase D
MLGTGSTYMQGTVTRRRFIAGAAGAGAGLALGGSVPGWARKRPRLLRASDFPSGLMAGFPGRHTVTLWTAVEQGRRPALLGVEVARDPDFRRVVHRGRIRVARRRDSTARIRIANRRILRPGEDYWYRFYTRRTDSPVGHFRTRRPPDSREPIRVAFFSCQGWEAGYYTAHEGLANELDLDLVVSLGDYIYEETDDVGPRVDRTGTGRDGNAQTLAEYRQKYRLYRSDPNLQAMHAAHAFAHVPDDHDIESGFHAPRGEGDTQGFPRRVSFEERQRAATRAMFEHQPLRAFRSDRSRVYRSMRLGRHAEVFLTDLHRYADAYPCPSGPKAGPIAVGPCDERWDPRRSLLGARQKNWLKAGLSSPATWKVWGSTLMMEGLEYAPGLPYNLGQWDGYGAERRELMEFVLDRRIENVAVVSGDIHTFFAGHVTTTGSVDGRTGAVEFVGGSISSEGIPDTIADEGYKDVLGAFTDNVRGQNPHMAYADTKHRGYCVLTAGARELTAEFRAPRTALEPQSEVFTIARFRVPAGRQRVEQI